MRISDQDRQRAVEELGQHMAAGRLDLDEYTARLGEIFCAETLADVDHARRDLPFMRVALPTGEHRSVLARDESTRAYGTGSHWQARLVLALSVLLVVVGVVVALVGQAVWVLLLVAGWVIGLLQGRVYRSRR